MYVLRPKKGVLSRKSAGHMKCVSGMCASKLHVSCTLFLHGSGRIILSCLKTLSIVIFFWLEG